MTKTVKAADGSEWIVSETRPRYGRPVPVGREFWFQRCVGSVSPEWSALRGIAGFYASHPDGRRAA